MKPQLLCVAVLALSGCVTHPPAPADDVPPVAIEALRAFENLCLKTAPSFAGAEAAASGFGITPFIDVGGLKMGMGQGGELSVQITPGQECAVTIPGQRSAGLTRQFLQSVGRYTDGKAIDRVPARISLGGTAFIAQHDRKGGEAFVLLKAR